MEVHAHTHTSRKRWTHYLWEFIMLFLAVFCGFLAEYQLEHKVEKERGRQYIRSFAEDLKSDTANLVDMIHQYEEKAEALSHMHECYKILMQGKNADSLLLRIVPHSLFFP